MRAGILDWLTCLFVDRRSRRGNLVDCVRRRRRTVEESVGMSVAEMGLDGKSGNLPSGKTLMMGRAVVRRCLDVLPTISDSRLPSRLTEFTKEGF